MLPHCPVRFAQRRSCRMPGRADDIRATLGRPRQVGHDEADAWIRFAEQWSKEGKGAIKWTRLSCRTFAANAARLQLHVLATDILSLITRLRAPPAPA